MVMLEAFREGAPVIARDLGPYPQIIEESEGGLLFQTQDDLRAAMLRLIREPGLRDTMGQAGRAALMARWSEGVAMDAYLDLIEETARAKGRTRAAERAAETPRANAAVMIQS